MRRRMPFVMAIAIVAGGCMAEIDGAGAELPARVYAGGSFEAYYLLGQNINASCAWCCVKAGFTGYYVDVDWFSSNDCYCGPAGAQVVDGANYCDILASALE